MRLGKEDVDAETDGEVKHHAYHGSGDGRERRVEKPYAAQLLDLWRAKEDHTVEAFKFTANIRCLTRG
jgi:hypothetical protein